MPKLRLLVLATLLSLALPGAAAARAGDAGPVTILGKGRNNLSGAAVALQGDGRATVVGSKNGRGFLVARVRRNGAPDRTFGRRGTTAIHFHGATAARGRAVSLFRDGRILVAGTVTIGGVQRFGVARLLPGGRLDPNFGSGGAVLAGPAGAQLETMALQPTGELVLAGSVREPGRRAVLVVRLLPDGTTDRSFGAGGAVDSVGVKLAGRARDVTVMADGRIALAVSIERGRTARGTFLAARLTPDGAFDPTFNGDGVTRIATTSRRVHDGGAAALSVSRDGRMLLAGTARGGGGREDATLVRVNADGSSGGVTRVLDPRRRSVRVVDMRRDSRSHVVLAVRVSGLGGGVLRLRSNLHHDVSFGAGGLAAGRLPRTRVAALALRPRMIVLAGSARVGGHGRLVSARFS